MATTNSTSNFFKNRAQDAKADRLVTFLVENAGALASAEVVSILSDARWEEVRVLAGERTISPVTRAKVVAKLAEQGR